MSTCCLVAHARYEESVYFLEEQMKIQDNPLHQPRYVPLFYDPFSLIVIQSIKQSGQYSDYMTRNKEMSNYETLITRTKLRTKYFDDAIETLVKDNQVTQIVMLGCGMDGRSFRMSCLSTAKVFEVDQLEVIQTRNYIISSKEAIENNLTQIAKSRHHVVANVYDRYNTDQSNTATLENVKDWRVSLVTAGYSFIEKTIWVLEGLLMYLTEQTVKQLLSDIHYMSSTGSSIILHHINRKIYEDSLTSANEIHQSWISYFPDDYELVMQSLGWNVEQLCSQGQIHPIDVNWGRMPHFPSILQFNEKTARNLIRNDIRAGILAIMKKSFDEPIHFKLSPIEREFFSKHKME